MTKMKPIIKPLSEIARELDNDKSLIKPYTKKDPQSESKSEVRKKQSISIDENYQYQDDLFDKVKKVIREDESLIIKSIKFIQEGTRLIFYQGLKSNVYGVIESRLNKTYKLRIHNSFLLRQLKAHELTKEFFKEV